MSETTDFEAGAIWALELLKKQTEERGEILRQMLNSVDADTGHVLNGIRNVIYSVQSQFEVAFVREIKKAEKERKS